MELMKEVIRLWLLFALFGHEGREEQRAWGHVLLTSRLSKLWRPQNSECQRVSALRRSQNQIKSKHRSVYDCLTRSIRQTCLYSVWGHNDAVAYLVLGPCTPALRDTGDVLQKLLFIRHHRTAEDSCRKAITNCPPEMLNKLMSSI